jgi:RNA ligase
MQPEYTYLFEIIYPENRIIVDYGDREELVLLAVIHTETGREITDFEDVGFPVLKSFEGFCSFDDVLKFNIENTEGVVVRFANGYRFKVKFEEYLRLHSMMLSLTGTKIWRYLSKGNDLEKLYEISGEEHRSWIKTTAEKILSDYDALNQKVMEEFHALPPFKSQKEAAEYIIGKEHAVFLFSLLNGKPIEKILWQHVKPDENASWFAERG